MIISRCCKASVRIRHANEGVSYYECCQCDMATDTINPCSVHKDVMNAKVQPGFILETFNL